jgi:Flp pilus assembly protein TadD
MTKADVLDAMGRQSEAAPLRAEAMPLGNAFQLNGYGRQLQRDGKQDEAFAVFHINAKRNPGHFIVHYEQARMACATGDFDSAVKEMQLAVAGSTPDAKSFLEGFLKRLQAKEDINKN